MDVLNESGVLSLEGGELCPEEGELSIFSSKNELLMPKSDLSMDSDGLGGVLWIGPPLERFIPCTLITKRDCVIRALFSTQLH